MYADFASLHGRHLVEQRKSSCREAKTCRYSSTAVFRLKLTATFNLLISSTPKSLNSSNSRISMTAIFIDIPTVETNSRNNWPSTC